MTMDFKINQMDNSTYFFSLSSMCFASTVHYHLFDLSHFERDICMIYLRTL